MKDKSQGGPPKGPMTDGGHSGEKKGLASGKPPGDSKGKGQKGY